MKRVSLVQRAEGQTQVWIEAHINERGDLVIAGQDIGEAPQQIFGDSDYEYWLTIPQGSKERAYEALLDASFPVSAERERFIRQELNSDPDARLLKLLEQRYKDSSSVVGDIRATLDSRGISAEFFSY